jgi:hypothetical protein
VSAAASVTSTGTVVSGPARLLAVQVRATASAGSVVFRDGGASGTVRLTVYTPASAAALVVLPLPGGGVQFVADCHATLADADAVTVVYL